MKFCVAVFSMRSNWLLGHPERSKLRVRVLADSKMKKVISDNTVTGHLPPHYRRLMQEEGILEHDCEIAAWDAAVRVRDRLQEQNRSVELNLGEAGQCLYVFQMHDSVCSDGKFIDMNPQLRSGRQPRACLYVGKTSQERCERYSQHRDEAHPASTRWGTGYFLMPFAEAYRGDLILAYQQTGEATDTLTHYHALKGEYRLRCWLQASGFAAYSR